MKISGLAQEAGVPVATVKYYLREGLVPPGRALSRTQAEYDATHVERVRLVRALTEVGGLSLAAVAHVLRAIEDPGLERVDVMATAQHALVGPPGEVEPPRADRCPDRTEDGPGPDAEPASRAAAFAATRGWPTDPVDPFVDQLDAAWAACEQAGIGLDQERMSAYADAMEQVARVDVGSVPDEPQAAVRQVVLGTVLVDPVLAALRRLAQRHAAVGAGPR